MTQAFFSGKITDRQAEVVRLLALGHTDITGAAALGIKPRTFKDHCNHLRIKLQVRSRRDIPHAYYQQTGISPYPGGTDAA